MLLPIIVSLIYGEDWVPFVATGVIAAILGFVIDAICKDDSGTILAIDGFAIVSFSWIFMSLIGMLPFLFSGEIPSVADAFFETVSGFTTTGASILVDVEAMSHGMLFWRSFTHWVGGMGILVFVVAIANKMPGRTVNIMRAEMPGPSMDKLVPKARKNAEFLYRMYIALTLLEIIVLICEGMPVFDSIVHSLGTAGTGGFGIRGDSLSSYTSLNQWTIALFMLIFGVNFNLYYLIIAKRFRNVLRSNEFRTYIGIAATSTIIIAITLGSTYKHWYTALRHAFFQVASVLTTTGYATADFNAWPHIARSILLILMFIGGCSGSTAGGLKVSRVVVLAQSIRNQLHKMISPRSVSSVHLDGRKVDDEVVNKISLYFALYILVMIISFLAISFEPWSMDTNFSAVVACFNNIGPGFGLVGPAGNYSMYTDFSKFVLAFTMLLGRLEIYPLLLVFAHTGRRRVNIKEV